MIGKIYNTNLGKGADVLTNKLLLLLCLIFACLYSVKSFACEKTIGQAADQQSDDKVLSMANLDDEDDDRDYKWSVLFYYGKMTERTLARVLVFDLALSRGNQRSDLYSLELGYQLSSDNIIRRIFSPIVSSVHFANNLTYYNDPNGNLFEYNPYLRFVWQDFPWDHILITKFSIGEGLSYISNFPQREVRTPKKANNIRHLLNYLNFEAGFALPQYPQLEFLYRIHHRSGVFGLFAPGRVGSTAVGAAVRYNF